MKKILCFILVIVLLSVSVTVSVTSLGASSVPSQKEEVIYGLLNPDGSVNKLYVVNIFSESTITDYGNYSEIRNMTTSEQIRQQGDLITMNTKAEKFYYQGSLDKKELPWNIDIKYYINDKEVSASELAGMSGKLEIMVSISQNTNVNSIFYDNYALQASISLDNELCSNIKADYATIAEAGGKKQITFTALPGNPLEVSVSADVHDFEMEPITLNAILLNFGINIDSSSFSDKISELVKAVEELDNGAGQLLEGLNKLSEGINDYVNGLKAFNDGAGQLSTGIKELNSGVSALNYGLSELAKQNDDLVNGALALQQAAFNAVNAQIAGMGFGLPELTPDNYSIILSNIPELAAVKQQLDGAVQFTQGLKAYTDGLKQLEKGASDLAGGTAVLEASSFEIAAAANALYKGGIELNSAVKSLRDGLDSYKAGTKEFKNQTSNIDEEIDNQINELLSDITGKKDKAVSFVSNKNTNVTAVQFVLKTEPVKIQESPKAPEPEPVKLTFWQKLLRLLGLY